MCVPLINYDVQMVNASILIKDAMVFQIALTVKTKLVVVRCLVSGLLHQAKLEAKQKLFPVLFWAFFNE